MCVCLPEVLSLYLVSVRRAHLKECFETLKKNIPNIDEKKTSNLSVLRSALRYIQVSFWFLRFDFDHIWLLLMTPRHDLDSNQYKFWPWTFEVGNVSLCEQQQLLPAYNLQLLFCICQIFVNLAKTCLCRLTGTHDYYKTNEPPFVLKPHSNTICGVRHVRRGLCLCMYRISSNSGQGRGCRRHQRIKASP